MAISCARREAFLRAGTSTPSPRCHNTYMRAPTVVFFIKNLTYNRDIHDNELEQIAMIIPPIYTTRRYISLFFSTDCAVLLWKKIGLRREGDCRQCIQRSAHAWMGAYRSALLHDGWSQA